MVNCVTCWIQVFTMRPTLIIGLITLAGISNAQHLFEQALGGTNDEEGRSVVQTDDDGFLFLGSTESFGAGLNDIYLVRLDQLGDTIWTRTYGGTDDDLGHYISSTNDGGYIVTGSTSSFGAGSSDCYLLRLDSLGDTLWTRTYGYSTLDDYGTSVQQTTDEGYIITGNKGGGGVYLVKTDSLGDTLWTKTYGGTSTDEGHCVQQTTDGGYIITGYTGSYGSGSYDFYLIKTNFLGDSLWTKTFGGAEDE
ncbi:MAG: hypothetical protein IH946_07855, partial [Bacteroidetes bacterium]|nr:hypothetical protein [Bacteroidota bacterium]